MFTHLITVKIEGDCRNGCKSHPYHAGSFTVPSKHPGVFAPDVWNNVLQHGALPSGWSIDTKSGINSIVEHMKKELSGGRITSIRVSVGYVPHVYETTAWVTYAKPK